MAHEHYDIVIVGSGVAGALCAAQLSRHRRHTILMLEAGDNGITRDQHVIFQRTMTAQGGNRDSMHAPYQNLASRHYAPSPENAQLELEEQVGGREAYYDYAQDTRHAFKAGYNRIVGGSTWSWRGNCPRLIPADFRMQSQYGVGRDWPFGYDELEPYYVRAEWELGVSGDHAEWDGLLGAKRSRRFPMPAIDMSYSDTQIKPLIHDKTVWGKTVRVVTTPQARNSREYQGRPACEGESTCIPLCTLQAKYDATVHLRRAVERGVELRTGAVVTRLARGANGRVAEVVYRPRKSSDPMAERSVRAGIVVLAAHAIETPRILLMSEDLANASGQVGRNLMDHVQFEVIATFPQPLFPFRGPQSVTSIEDFRDGRFRREHSGFRMTIGNDGWGRTGSPANVIERLLKGGVWGSALPGAIVDKMSRMIRLSLSTEMLPDPNNRVSLSPKLDRLGLPRPRFNFDIPRYTDAAIVQGEKVARELFALMGATLETGLQRSLRNDRTGRLNWSTGNHIMGTTVMGTSARDSVVNGFGRAHDVPNLWIVGSSVFPTGGTANSTLTIAALTLRTADAIAGELR